MQPLDNTPPSKDQVWKMFDQISNTYDKVNRAMTAGRDLAWRKKVGTFLPQKHDIHLLDLATGTGDQIFSLLESYHQISYAVGIDMASLMLELAQKKRETFFYKEKISFIEASALDIPYANESFDCVTMSFGIRNVTCPATCLQEIFRSFPESASKIVKRSFAMKAH